MARLLHGCGDSTAGDETGASATASSSGTPTTSGEGDACLECVVAKLLHGMGGVSGRRGVRVRGGLPRGAGGSLGMCSNTCNLDSDLYQALYFCGQGSCLGTCEWDCC